MSRFLTKSRFKVGYECPTKLHFLDNKEYGNNNTENSFLEALAEGGFQVGELAKVYHPGGIEIQTHDKDRAADETAKLLDRDSVVIYEASFKYENLFIKADVVVKNGNDVELIEVKAKSFDPSEQNSFFTKTSIKKGKPQLNSEWEPYVIDAAFQTFVFRKAFPQLSVSTFLMLADKTAVATVDGINQKFFLDKGIPGKVAVKVAPGTLKVNLGKQLLCKVQIDNEVKVAWNGKYLERSFPELVQFLSDLCANGKFAEPVLSSSCKSCEFRIGNDKKEQGLKSGFEKCWQHGAKLSPADFSKPFVFDVWNFRKSQSLLEDGKIFMDQIEEEDVSPKDGGEGLSSSERQWLQIKKLKDRDDTPFFDHDRLAYLMKSWKFPLHFIDFETTMAAIPFNKGRRPYEQIAFQFSHHVVEKDGTVRHASEFLNKQKGIFPNFDFVRALRGAIGNCEGTVFRYAAHENTVLCQIRDQLRSTSDPIPDKDELVGFIESITASTGDSEEEWVGARNMVDLCELVKLFYYSPYTKGSNSIKKVLPAILNESDFLKSRYSQPVYGTTSLKSSNYSNWTWVQLNADGTVKDPYKLLPPVFDDVDLEAMDALITDGSLADGGAAMTAYARMQFTEMSALEADRVAKALLKYCELDTFAMVLIYQHWKNEIDNA